MGALKTLAIDFAELSIDPEIQDFELREQQFDEVMTDLLNNTETHERFMLFVRMLRVIRRINLKQDRLQQLRWATKLWNLVDTFDRPEPFWRLMVRSLPFAFYEPSPNCLRFTY